MRPSSRFTDDWDRSALDAERAAIAKLLYYEAGGRCSANAPPRICAADLDEPHDLLHGHGSYGEALGLALPAARRLQAHQRPSPRERCDMATAWGAVAHFEGVIARSHAALEHIDHAIAAAPGSKAETSRLVELVEAETSADTPLWRNKE